MATGSADLTTEAKKLLAARLAGTLGAKARDYQPTRAPGTQASFPLSSDQLRLYFLHELDPTRPDYNVHGAFRIEGRFEVDRLRAAFSTVMDRHEVLRSHFVAAAPEPVQVIEDDSPTVAFFDFSNELDPVREVVKKAEQDALEPFDLLTGPLFRPWVARLGSQDHVFGFSVHHLIFDRDSLSILISELKAECEGRSLPALRARYGDYTRWQRASSHARERDIDRSYWRKRLNRVPPVLELPTDRPHRGRIETRAGAVELTVSPQTAQALRILASKRNTTTFIPALAAFQALLLRFSYDVPAIAVGCPFNARTQVEFEGLIGFFARSLPLVIESRDDLTLDSMVSETRDAMLDAHDHQQLPLSEIVTIAEPFREVGTNPLFQVWFDLANDDYSGETEFGGARMYPLPVRTMHTRFDLELHLVDAGGDGMNGVLLFRKDLFDESTAVEIARQYEHLLSSAAAAPYRRISSIPLIPEDEEENLLSQWTTPGPLL